MTINQLIALGGTQHKSPVDRYLEAQRVAKQDSLNELAAVSTQQKMQLADQEQKMKLLAPIAKNILSMEPELRQTAWEEALGMMPRYGIPMEGAPGQWNDQIGQALMQAGGLGLDKQDKGTYMTAVDRQGNRVPAVARDGMLYHPVTGEHMTEWMKAPTRQETSEVQDGFGDSTQNKERQAAIASREGVYVAHDAIGNLIEKARNSPEWKGGVSGTAVQLWNSAKTQFDSFVRLDPVILPSGTVNPKAVGALGRENMTWLRETAMQTGTLDAAIRDFAYVLAKARDPGGKLSDRDVAEARVALDSSDRAIMIQKMMDLDERLISEYNSKRESRKETRSYDYYAPLDFKSYTEQSKGVTPDVTDDGAATKAAEDALREMGIDF